MHLGEEKKGGEKNKNESSNLKGHKVNRKKRHFQGSDSSTGE